MRFVDNTLYYYSIGNADVVCNKYEAEIVDKNNIQFYFEGKKVFKWKISAYDNDKIIIETYSNSPQRTDKVRGEKKATACNFSNMKRLGYHGGKLIIDHCFNEKAANALKDMTLAEFPDADVVVAETRGLCSYYAEKGGLIIGFEVN